MEGSVAQKKSKNVKIYKFDVNKVKEIYVPRQPIFIESISSNQQKRRDTCQKINKPYSKTALK